MRRLIRWLREQTVPLPKGRRVSCLWVLIGAMAGLLSLCCGIAMVQAALRDIGILPTLTPSPTPTWTDTPRPTSMATATYTPLPASTATATLTAVPTGTPTSTGTATSIPSPTDTPTVTLTPLPTDTPGPPCACTSDLYKCDDFVGGAAQRCYDYCVSLGAGDIHRLDGDGDGRVCE